MINKAIAIFYKTVSLIDDILSFICLLPARIYYRIYRIEYLRSYQLNFEFYTEQVQNCDFKSDLHNYAVLPGRVLEDKELSLLQGQPGIHEKVADAFDHKYVILSGTPFDINHSEGFQNSEFDRLIKHLNICGRLCYKRINWHKDFKSGYEWNSSNFYNKIKVAERADADIKVPRELSRFNHIGLLVLGERIVGKKGAHEFMLQVVDWASQNKFGCGVNWACTMDIGLRAVNWVWGMSLFRKELAQKPEFVKFIKRLLYFHGIHIENNLEYSPVTTGNHYLSNIVGLLYISAFLPEADESDRWLLFCIQELLSEMQREVYDDGMAHEGSTHYHRLVTELFISAALVIERIPVKRLKELNKVKLSVGRIPVLRKSVLAKINITGKGNILPMDFYKKLFKMGVFTAAITKQNGNVPQIGDNDSARVHKIVFSSPENFSDHRHILATISKMFAVQFEGVYLSLQSEIEADILMHGINLDPPPGLVFKEMEVRHFKNAGIVSVKKKDINLIVTCGQNGQQKRGGHNHNDKLSFELNLFGYDVFVDSGCPIYSANPKLRNYFRGTAVHNTVKIDNKEQERWRDGIDGLFALRQKSPPLLYVNKNNIIGAHFGYEVPHRRIFSINKSFIRIDDFIKSKKEKVFNLTINPDIIINNFLLKNNKLNTALTLPNGKIILLTVAPVEKYYVSEVDFGYSYGVLGRTNRLSIVMGGYTTSTLIDWGDNRTYKIECSD